MSLMPGDAQPAVTDTPSCQCVVVLGMLQNHTRQLRRQLAAADPDRVTTAQAGQLLEAFAEIKRLAEAGMVLFAPRAVQSTAWRDQGHRSPAEWVAKVAKSGVGEAMATLETAEALEELPATAQAMRHGELSFDQAKHIAAAATRQPRAEAELLHTAAEGNLKLLLESCSRVRATASSAEEENARHRAIHKGRYLRSWCETSGAFRLDARFTPEAGAKVVAAVETEAKAIFEEARKSETRESPAAYAADALVALVSGEHHGDRDPKARRGSGALVHIRVDATALKRGHVGPGEMCEVAGVGPVPVASAHRAMSDAVVKIVVRDAVDVYSVCHVGRSVTASVQTALEERDPTCVVPGCAVTHRLENHHWKVPFAESGTSSLKDLARVCAWHHDLLTYDGYELTGGPGKWCLRSPPEPAAFDTG